MMVRTDFDRNVGDIQSLKNEFLLATQTAAVASYPWIGRGDKAKSDEAATEAMRNQLNTVDMNARIVIGEGEMDEAPMLYIGEKLGMGKGPEVDIAVDPVEGTTPMATGQDNSLTVIAVAEKGSLLHAPDMYMEKIAVGPKAKGSVDISVSLKENLANVANALEKDISELTVMIQNRPRHDHLIKQVFEVGARVKLFSDVDITGAIATTMDDKSIDILVGTGGAPEGVVAAVALKCLGGDFQAKLVPNTEEEYNRCIEMGISDPRRVLKIDDIVQSDKCFFAATGITEGHLLRGVRESAEGMIETHSLIASSKGIRFISSSHA